jgi:hypothetical protein
MSSFSDNLSELFGRYPYNEAFIEAVRQRVIRECSKVPVHIHKRTQAQNRLELAAREAIVLHFDEAFEDAWFPFTLRPGWPLAHCIIKGNTALIEFSFGPETDGHRGGQEIEPVQFAIMRQKPNILSKALQAFNKRDLKAEREPEPAPIGTPDGRPELKLSKPLSAPRAPAKPTPTQPPKAKAKLTPRR